MKLIIGGAYQGKTAYVKERFGISDQYMLHVSGTQNMEDFLAALCDATSDVKCVTQFHLLVRYAMEQGLNVYTLVEQMLLAHPDIIILMDEVGSGIIPLEKEERLYREQAGRVSCMLAERASQVVRMICGIGTVLKDTK